MCVIVYKPEGVDLPDEITLRSCFVQNPDGAGYMLPSGDGVLIKKGYMSFSAFYNAVLDDYNKDKPLVMHFRIGTQGGNTPQNTHPFPLSDEVDDLRELKILTEVGIAHNGIINLTSNYKMTNTSDTMDFITEYLSLIINDSDWYKGKYFGKDKLLVERLIGGYNKLAIMSKDGHTELIGEFQKDGECYYSNLHHKNTYAQYKLYDSYDDYDIISYGETEEDNEYTLEELYEMGWTDPDGWREELDLHYHKYLARAGWFDFNPESCPAALEGDFDWCTSCLNYAKCNLDAGDDFDKNDCTYGDKCSGCKYKKDCPNNSGV